MEKYLNQKYLKVHEVLLALESAWYRYKYRDDSKEIGPAVKYSTARRADLSSTSEIT